MTLGLPLAAVGVGVLGTEEEGTALFTSLVKVTEKRKGVTSQSTVILQRNTSLNNGFRCSRNIGLLMGESVKE